MASISITQAAKALGVAPHKLIHLCERKVVTPEVKDARGRGTSRQFSRRNLFEFAVALEMRRLELPVSFVRAVLRVLRAFEAELHSGRPDFALPDALLRKGAPEVRLLILDGERLYFRVRQMNRAGVVLGGVNIRHPQARGRARKHETVGRLLPAQAKEALSAAHTRTEVDLSRIARGLQARLGEP
jgi:DNA-binding transcriptional MerR regulator